MSRNGFDQRNLIAAFCISAQTRSAFPSFKLGSGFMMNPAANALFGITSNFTDTMSKIVEADTNVKHKQPQFLSWMDYKKCLRSGLA
jgi:TctA family transporter